MTVHYYRRIAPFRHPRITAYLRLPVAFRSLSRLSSAPSAKAFALRPFLLDHSFATDFHQPLCEFHFGSLINSAFVVFYYPIFLWVLTLLTFYLIRSFHCSIFKVQLVATKARNWK